jgi:hypothetical protein
MFKALLKPMPRGMLNVLPLSCSQLMRTYQFYYSLSSLPGCMTVCDNPSPKIQGNKKQLMEFHVMHDPQFLRSSAQAALANLDATIMPLMNSVF